MAGVRGPSARRRTPRRDRALVGIALIVGPLIEAAYIQLGGLHHYELGWFFGVPLWIVLWWALGAWLWADLAPRVERVLERALDRSEPRERRAA